MRFIALVFIILSPVFVMAQTQDCAEDCSCTVSGTIIDAQTLEPIPFVTVQIKGTNKGVITDEQGAFSIKEICKSEFDIEVAHVGFKPVVHHHDSYHKNPTIKLAPDEIILESIVVEDERSTTGISSLHETKLSGKDLSAIKDQSLGNVMASITGVSTLKTGSNIVKPIIHGMHSNRILIVNNGIRHESQDWGEAHAPEIDPSLANNISLIKGAAAVKYGPNALGGVIIINPPKMELDDHFHGEVALKGESNGKAFDGNILLQKGKKNFAWLLQASGRYQGDLRAPDYNLSNTGMREMSVAGGFLYHWRKVDLKAYYSHVEQELGVLRGSVVGNLEDLADALADDEPDFTEAPTYDIATPRQEVNHDLFKLESNINWQKSRLNLLYGFQVNKRKEFDVRRGTNNERPSIDLELFTHTFEAEWLHASVNDWNGSIGVQMLYQDNNNLPGTNTIPFVPNYNNSQAGIYMAESREVGNSTFELGARYDMLVASARIRDINNDVVSFDQSYQSVSGIIGWKTEISASRSFRVNIATAWRPPSIAELFSYGKHRSNLQYGFYRYSDNAFPDDIDTNEEQDNELGYKLTTTYEHRGERFRLEATPYINYIRNYIYAEPRDVLQTVRGSFPAFAYVRTDALFAGVDAVGVFSHSQHLESKVSGTYLYAQDIDKSAVLFGVPANKLSYDITFSQKIRQKHPYEIGLNAEYVFEQYRAPRVITPEQFIQNDDFDPFENDRTPFDFKEAPDGYFLLSLQSEVNVRQWVVGIRVNNLLNATYREYTDLLRYFADQPGINFQLSLKYQL